jgi:heterotetrameric sarcosine oxidase gamma subunit
MPEFMPIARSPIVPAPPVARLGGWEVSAHQSTAPMRLLDLTPCAKLLLHRTSPSAQRELLPALGRAMRVQGGPLVVAAVPEQWLLLGPPGAAPSIQHWIDSIAEPTSTLIDYTHARVILRVAGEHSARLLSKLCVINFGSAAFPNRRAVRSLIAKVPCEIVRDDLNASPQPTDCKAPLSTILSYLLVVESQIGQYLFDSLMDAGSEYQIDVDGFSFN